MRAHLVRRLSILLATITALFAPLRASAQRATRLASSPARPKHTGSRRPACRRIRSASSTRDAVIDLATKPTRFVVHVSADNRYRLYVNGVQVSSGPQRSDASHWRYETVDLAPQLAAGANVIAAVVWNWGPHHPVAQHSLRTAFLLQADSPNEAAANTGPGWKLLRDSAYAEERVRNDDVRAYYAAAQGERVDGARYPWGWERRDFDDSRWYAIPASPRGAGGEPADRR